MTTKGVRTKGREIALQVLYLMEWVGWDIDIDRAISECLYFRGKGNKKYKKDHPSIVFCKGLIEGVVSNLQQIDSIIKKSSKNWRLERMAIVDRNILRIGCYELLFSDDVPYKVAINEAVELSKHFGTEDSRSFVNGVLDAMQETPDTNKIKQR